MRLGVCMIVKNEERVIRRCLDSILPHVDTWCIIDTGSTDRTMQIIKETALQYGKIGVLEERPWVNFGHNRTEALELARNYMEWCIVIDADDSFEGEFSKDFIHPDEYGYNITLKHGEMRSRRCQLMNLVFPWKYVGALHEYAHCPGKPIVKNCLPDSVWIVARSEGARAQDPDKYNKDAVLLENEMESGEADTGRTLFYLAQSYRDAGNSEKAIETYKRRAKFTEGWAEENYISYLNLIRLVSDIDEKVWYAWKAQNLIPSRRECVFEIMSQCRKRDIWRQDVYAMGFVYKHIPLETTHLFVETHAYGWSYDDELSIIAYYLGYLQTSAESASRALWTCPDNQQERIKENVRLSRNKLLE